MEVDKVTRDWFMGVLSNNIVGVKFTKRDGSERDMRCTLREDIVPQYEKKTDKVKKENLDVVAVWDIDKKEWRSFKISSLILIDLNLKDPI